MSKKIKTFVIVVVIIAIIIGAFSYLSNSKPQPATTLLNSSVSPAAGMLNNQVNVSSDSEFSSLLSTVNTIVIDTSIFESAAYKSLRDSPITLGSDIKGRPNPFAPVGSDRGTISGTTETGTAQFETLQPIKVTATTAEFGAQAMLSSTVGAQVIFEYGENDLLSSATAPVDLASNGTVLVKATGLNPDTTYYVRAVLTQGSNVVSGDKMKFTTSKAPR